MGLGHAKRCAGILRLGEKTSVSAFFWVPSVGSPLVAGPLAASILGAIEGAVAVGGLSALAAGLYSLGIPRDSVLAFEGASQAGKYGLIAHGTPEQVALAKRIIEATEATEVTHHPAEAPGRPVEDPAADEHAAIGVGNGKGHLPTEVNAGLTVATADRDGDGAVY
jgi:hypothetical protein